MDHFSLTDEQAKYEARKTLKINNDSFVLSYLGSIGTWYMLEEMLLFFRQLKRKYNTAKFLFLTHSDPRQIYSKADSLEIDKSDLIVKEADRGEVPQLLKASDVNISFIKPVYSKISSSPTKLGEVLSVGIPVIVNAGVGDVQSIVEYTNGGYVLQSFTENEFEKIIEALPQLMKKDSESIRKKAAHFYSLQHGIELYRKCYNELLPVTN
jgi:glycosyltransferase involved in cell wall biosynthesis